MLLLLATLAQAGLGPDDVMVLYNADDPEAVETADQYAAARDLAPDHLCAITGIEPTTREVDFATFDTAIRQPFEACRDALSAPDDIDAIVVVRGLPYRVTLTAYVASLTATLQVGRATLDNGPDEVASLPQQRSGPFFASVESPVYIRGGVYSQDTSASFGANPYYMTSPRLVRGEATPGGFERIGERVANGWDFTDELYIVTRLDGFDHDDARAIIDRSVLADGSFPEAPFLCMRAADGARGARDGECEHALRMIDAAGGNTAWVNAFDSALADREVISYWTGAANMRGAIDGVTYAPGAVADNLTSFGAAPQNFFCDDTGETCPASESQTSMARFIRAGASATQGTVAEPLNNVFPNAGFLVLYHRGYTLGEAWLYNMRFLHWVNTWIGDPLMAPFAERPLVQVPAEVALNDELAPSATHPDGIARIAMYADGVKVFDDADPSLPGRAPEDWGAQPGDIVEVLVVATAAAPPALEFDGWPAVAPVPLDPGVKGWTRTVVTIGDALPDPEIVPDPEGCGGCASTTPPAGLGLVLIGGLIGWRRRRSRRLSRGIGRTLAAAAAVAVSLSACGVGDGVLLTELDEDEFDKVCEPIEPRDIPCGEGSTISLGTDCVLDEPIAVSAACAATVGDYRDCAEALNLASDEALCEGFPEACDRYFTEACVGG